MTPVRSRPSPRREISPIRWAVLRRSFSSTSATRRRTEFVPMSTAPILTMRWAEPPGLTLPRRQPYHGHAMFVKSETLAGSKNGGTLGRENLLGMTVPELEKLFHALGEKPYRGRQVAEW